MASRLTRRQRLGRALRTESLELRAVLDSTVVFNELMYHPTDQGSQGEWIELHNAMTVDVDMSNWSLAGGVDFTFPAGTILEGGDYLVVAATPAAVTQAYPLARVLGPFTGAMANSGERIELRNHTQRLMDVMTYEDAGLWPVGPDGSGVSLAKVHPQAGTAQIDNWISSLEVGGTPGTHNFVSSVPASPMSSLRLEEIPAAGNADFWMELKNEGQQSINLQGMVLRSDKGAQAILGAQEVAAGDRAVISRAQLNFTPSNQDRLFLYTPQATHLVDAVTVSDQLQGRADAWNGRWMHPNQPTPGAPNSFSFQDAVVINEIQYHARPTYADPAAGQTFQDSTEEWLEIFNRGAQPVNLSGWQFRTAVDFTAPNNTILAPGEYAIVALDPSEVASKYPGVRILGGYEGTLSNSDDLIQLFDAQGNLADEVHYYDGGYWPEFADGGGQSIELRDPMADNSVAQNWAGSNETGRSSWKSYSYTRTIEPIIQDPPINFHELFMGLLDAGVVWIDNVRVFNETTGQSLIQNGTFDTQAVDAPAEKWRIQGTHGTSHVIADPDQPGNQILQLEAVGRMSYLQNHAETTLANGAKVVNGQTYTISYDAKWIAGSPQLHTELYYKDASKTTILAQPSQTGTPGARNTRWVENLGPTIGDLKHFPVVPNPEQSVTISARAADPDQVTGLDLLYAVEGKAPYTRVTMQRQSDGSYTAVVPPQPNRTVVQFYVEATDGRGATSVYPPEGPNSRALFQSRTTFTRDPLRHDFQIIMVRDESQALQRLVNMMDNHHRGATVVYDGEQVFYDVGARLRGSMFSRQNIASAGYNVRFRPDEMFRGVHENVSFDQNGEVELLVKFTTTQSGHLGGTYDDVMQLITPSGQGGGATLTYLSGHGDVFLGEQFENGEDGTLFEFEGIRVMTSTVDGKPESLKIFQPIGWMPNFDIQDLGDDKELYRWPFLIDGSRDRDDYSRLIDLAKAFSLRGPEQEVALADVIDIDNWTQTFALMSLFGIGDVYSQGNPHNLNIYVRPEDNKVLSFPWDWDFTFNQPATAPLHGNQNIGRILDLPNYEHLLLGHMDHLMNTVFNRKYLQRWASHFATLLRESSINSMMTNVDARTTFVRGKLPQRVSFLVGTESTGVDETSLVTPDTAGQILLPSETNGGSTLGDSWIQPAFQPSDAWKTGPIAVGFEPQPGVFAPFIKTTIAEMANSNPTVYVRAAFELGPDAAFDELVLRMQYDDGFIAYLNGVRVAESGAPATPNWNSGSTTTRANSEVVKVTEFSLSEFKSLLKPGTNVLAIHGMNRNSASNDALFVPQLIGQKYKEVGPVSLATDQSALTVDGRGWVNVKSIQIRGQSAPLPVQWLDATTWRTTIPLQPGQNELILDAYNFGGDLIASRAVTITTTASNPLLDYLRISEVMYHPAEPNDVERAAGFATDDEFEYLELTNISSPGNGVTLDLTGIAVSDGVTFAFNGGSLAPGEQIIIAANESAFRARYGNLPKIAGTFEGQLNNGGEALRLSNSQGTTLIGFAYDDSLPWPVAADGTGPSLELINPAQTPRSEFGQAARWRASAGQGTPGIVGATSTTDWNGDGQSDGLDLDLLCLAVRQNRTDSQWDVDGNQQVNRDDVRWMVANVLNTVIGDVNMDGIFNSRDLVQIFAAGEYEDALTGNSSWRTGDWNCDGEFTSADFVEAFVAGSYTEASRPASRDALMLAAAVDAAFRNTQTRSR